MTVIRPSDEQLTLQMAIMPPTPAFAVGDDVKRRLYPQTWRVVRINPDLKNAKWHTYYLTNDAGHRMAQFECDLERV